MEDRGPVTRSRRNVVAEEPPLASQDEQTSQPIKVMSPETVMNSPVRMTRSKRLSISNTPIGSPARNLRGRTVSPEPVKVASPPKTKAPMTPTRRLRKNDASLFSTVDSPKPKKPSRRSLSESTSTEPVNLRRSRRLSTELNILQEDPIKEADVEPIQPLSATKSLRSGKRLSVMPSQPSLPEEVETVEVEEEKRLSIKAVDVQKSPEKNCDEAKDKSLSEEINKLCDDDSNDDKPAEESSRSNKSLNNSNNLNTSVENGMNESLKERTSISPNKINTSPKRNSPRISAKDFFIEENRKLHYSPEPMEVDEPMDIDEPIDDEVKREPNESLNTSCKSRRKSNGNQSLDISQSKQLNESISRSSPRLGNKSISSPSPGNTGVSSPRLGNKSISSPRPGNTGVSSPNLGIRESTEVRDSGDDEVKSVLSNSKSGHLSFLNESIVRTSPRLRNKSINQGTVEVSNSGVNSILNNSESGLNESMNKSSRSRKSSLCTLNVTSDRNSSPLKEINESLNKSSKASPVLLNKSISRNSPQLKEKTFEQIEEVVVDISVKPELSELLNESAKSRKSNSNKSGNVSQCLNESKGKATSPHVEDKKRLSSAKIDESSPKNSLSKYSAVTSTPLPSKITPSKLQNTEKEENGSSDDDVEGSEEDDEETEIKFIDDAASDAGTDYESGDSMDDSKRIEMEENEIIEKGETLGSENSEVEDEDESYEKDSFLVSSDEEDEELLSGTGDDLSSGEELSMSQKSKKKYNEKQLKKQKKASKEMFEARHSLDKSSPLNNSGKNSFVNSEKDISVMEASMAKDPLSNSIPADENGDDNDDSADSSDGEEIAMVQKTFDEELLRLQNNLMEDTSSSESASEQTVIVSNKKSKTPEKLDVNIPRPKKSNLLNKSDTALSVKKPSASNINKSMDVKANQTSAVSVQESMERLMNLNQSLSKVFTSLVKDMDRITDNAGEAPVEDVAPSDVVSLENKIQSEIEQIHSKKRKLSVGTEDRENNQKKAKIDDDKQKTELDSPTSNKENQSKVVNKTDKKKSKKKSPLQFESHDVKPKTPIKSTSKFQVESVLPVRPEINCTGTAGTFSVAKVAKGGLLRNISSGTLESTTAFRVACLKQKPKDRAVQVQKGAEAYVNFREEMLYGKKIKRETSDELSRKRQKLKASQMFRRNNC